MRKKLNFFKRFTSAALALCCLFSMFPSAGAANTSTKEKRSIWLISQPGFGVRIEQPTSGNTGVYFMNMSEEKELSQMDSSLLSVKPFCSYVVSNWCQTNPTMPKSGGISRLFSPAASSYADSIFTAIDLPKRRERLTQMNFCSVSSRAFVFSINPVLST